MRTVWSVGMHASGSTWVYNVIRGLVQATGARLAAGFANTEADLAALPTGADILVVKTHDLADAAAEALHARAPAVVASIRDPRDAVASLMTYQRYPFDLALATISRSAGFTTATAERTNALLLRYEAGFVDDPATVNRIATHLGLPCDEQTAGCIHAAHRRDAVERLIGGLETLPGAHRDVRSGDIYDPQTQWHRHHAGRSGEVGRWRRALPGDQARVVDFALANWMDRHGYARAATPAPSGTIRLGDVSFRHR
jgi:hypothetical protein